MSRCQKGTCSHPSSWDQARASRNEEQTIRLLEDDGSFEEFLRDHGIFEGDGLYDGLIHENELVGEGTALHAAQDPPCSRKTR